jgi:3-deoxy-D-manno-octulosonate 8-phosphate phosphatase (KDO 8-P phosphatase)
MKKELLDKAKKIKLVILDVDGVLTDGHMVYGNDGNCLKFFDVKDGLGIYFLIESGITVVILTAKSSKIVAHRAKDLRIQDVYEGLPKERELPRVFKKYKVKPEQVCFIGDDVIDIGCAKQVGFSVAVRDAVAELKKVADYTTPQAGGKGAVRHVAELILNAQKKWQF